MTQALRWCKSWVMKCLKLNSLKNYILWKNRHAFSYLATEEGKIIESSSSTDKNLGMFGLQKLNLLFTYFCRMLPAAFYIFSLCWQINFKIWFQNNYSKYYGHLFWFFLVYFSILKKKIKGSLLSHLALSICLSGCVCSFVCVLILFFRLMRLMRLPCHLTLYIA